MFSLCLRTTGGAAVSLGGPAWIGVIVVGGVMFLGSKALDTESSKKSIVYKMH